MTLAARALATKVPKEDKERMAMLHIDDIEKFKELDDYDVEDEVTMAVKGKVISKSKDAEMKMSHMGIRIMSIQTTKEEKA